MSHVRMRALYRALVELRALAKFGIAPVSPACLAGTAIDLTDGDLISNSGGTCEPILLDHVRAVGRRPTGGAVTAAEWRRLVKRLAAPAAGAFPGSAFERLLCAAGAAMAMKSSETQGVAIGYAGLGDLSRNEWKRVFPVIGQDGLPLVLVVFPQGQTACDLEEIAGRTATSPAKAVPAIPVDAGDPVAIYRVAQETLVRARAGGGAAVILGVPCGTDPVEILGRQLIRKGICTQRWVDGVGTHLTELINA